MSGYKTWADLEVLEAADVNGYLMSQAVPRFASTAARNVAIGVPVTGQLCHVAGTGLQTYSGVAWVSFDPSLVSSVAGRTGIVVLTKADVGLGSVDNTADAAKPVSTLQAAADTAAKARANHTGTQLAATISDLSTAAAAAAPVQSVAARVGAVVLTKADVGLSNADDTADAAKPVSTAQAAADALRVLKAGDTMTGLLALPAGLAGAGGLTIGADTNLYRSAADTLKTDDAFTCAGTLTPLANIDAKLDVAVLRDTYLAQNNTAKLYFGSAADTNLYRSAADSLKTDDTFQALRIGVGTAAHASIPLYLAPSTDTYGLMINNSAVAGVGYPLVQLIAQTAGSNMLGTLIGGDSQQRYVVQANGFTQWGPGNAGLDTNLYRSAADSLRTDDTFQALRVGIGATPSGTTALQIQGATAGTVAQAQRVSGDAADRYQVAADGKISWGGGAGAADASLYRSATATVKTDESLSVGATLRHLGSSLGFYGSTATTKPTVTGSRAGNAALASLLTALAGLGLITDSTTA